MIRSTQMTLSKNYPYICTGQISQTTSDPVLPEMGIPPSPVLWCLGSTVKSKKLLCEVEAVGLTLWFKCKKLLREEGGPIQEPQDAEEEEVEEQEDEDDDEGWVGKL